jgi:hypothetical protein
MSSIPNAKMRHAHAGDDTEHAPKPKPAKASPTLTERAQDLAEDAIDAVKARPKTAAAIGAAIVAGAAAVIGGPAAARALKGDAKPEKKAAKKTKDKS